MRTDDSTAAAAVLTAPRTLELRELPIPSVGDDDALLQVEACGICGSDVSRYNGTHGRWQGWNLIPGHEIVGTIAEIGSEAARRWGVRAGDRVAVEPIIACLRCTACTAGRSELCDGWPELFCYGRVPVTQQPALWGGFAEYMYLHPNTALHRVDPSVAADIATLFNPLAAGIKWAVTGPGTKLGDTAVVFGPGQRGLASVIALRAAGAGRIIVTGLASDRHKLDLALELGAHDAIESDRVDVVDAVMDLTNGIGADVVIDTTPKAARPVLDALRVARRGGTVALAGIKGDTAIEGFVSDTIVSKGLTVIGMFASDHESFARAVRIIEDGRIDVARLLTHRFSLSEAGEAIRTLAGEVDGANAIAIAVMPGRRTP